jgi:3-phosphoshikimate 1-carboxyvinyltransferase
VNHIVGVPGVDFTVGDVRPTFPEELEVTPLERPPDATIRVPGSKSVTNRALIIAALAEGHSRILNPLFSDDSFWLMNALVRLGIDVSADGERGEVYVSGQSGVIPTSGEDLFVGNAGTVARFLPPVLALGRGPYTVDGVPRMRERPVEDLVDAMRQLGAAVEYVGEVAKFPLTIRGGGIPGGEARVSASKSSQFISGLLMASPYAQAPVTLHPEGR